MMYRILYALVFILLMLGGNLSAQAETTEFIKEESIEQDLRRISERLRCPVCQSENLYDSKAQLAREMRAIIREKLEKGEGQDEIVSFFVARYGNFVLQEPPKSGFLLLLWLAPVLVVLSAGAGLTWYLYRSEKAGTIALDNASLDSEERTS